MPLFKQWNAHGGMIGIWKVEESIDELLSLLSDQATYRQQMQHLTADSRKMEYVAVRVLLKALLGREYHISHYDSGRPYLVEGGYHISISHTRGYVAVALHGECSPGIDIEYFADRVTKVVSRFVRPDEQTSVARYTGTPYIYMLLLHWSGKETLYKVIDREEVDFMEHLKIMPFDLNTEGEFDAQELKTPSRAIFRVSYMVHPDFVCTWCLKSVNY